MTMRFINIETKRSMCSKPLDRESYLRVVGAFQGVKATTNLNTPLKCDGDTRSSKIDSDIDPIGIFLPI